MTSPILSPTFHIGTIKIGSIAEASCFSMGNNFIEDFTSSKKHNQGLGNIHGDRNNFAHTTASLTNYESSQMKQEQMTAEKKENPHEKQRS
ncbi:hypothetical protein ACIQXV_15560 [Neobacillus sp. NPDC097160]|uniref:hypothetical protein n=1 Tax=Neobacillus sp. NPDC097160 TaxID=3364298 RepID=UPI0037F2CD8F